eukprot:10172067-Ditylum_brightwellii.AAC.1
MTRKALTVEEILHNFLHPTVPKVTSEPAYESIHRMHNILQENAASVHSNLGGCMYGHLALVLTPAHYQQFIGHIFVQPAHPGPNPPNPHAFILQHDLQAQRDQYYSQLHCFQVYKNTNRAIVKQICSAFNERFYKALRNSIV